MLVSIGLMLDNLAICLWNQETNTWHGVGTQSALIILILNISYYISYYILKSNSVIARYCKCLLLSILTFWILWLLITTAGGGFKTAVRVCAGPLLDFALPISWITRRSESLLIVFMIWPSHACPLHWSPHLQERMGYRIQTANWKRFSPTPLRALRFSGHGLVGLAGLAAEARQRSHASELVGYKWPISKSRAVAVLTVLTVLSLFSSHTEYCSSALLHISQWVPNPQTVPLLVPPWPAKKHKELSSEDIRTPLSEHWPVRFNDIQWLCMCGHVLQSAKNKESSP